MPDRSPKMGIQHNQIHRHRTDTALRGKGQRDGLQAMTPWLPPRAVISDIKYAGDIAVAGRTRAWRGER